MSGKENVLWKIDTSMDCVPNRTQNGRNQDLHPWKGYKGIFSLLEGTHVDNL